MYLGELGEGSGNIFLLYLQELMTTGYNNRLQNYKITKFTVFVSGSGSGDGGGQVQIKGEGRVQILVSLW